MNTILVITTDFGLVKVKPETFDYYETRRRAPHGMKSKVSIRRATDALVRVAMHATRVAWMRGVMMPRTL